MKRLCYIWLFLLISLSGFGQLTNSWIDYNKQYFKVKVAEDGVYRIDFTTFAKALDNAGVDTTNVVRRQDLQIFGRGVELYIHVEGSGPNIFKWDYIEFYGEKNTGWLDTAFYDTPNAHANPEISLFTDTATYYLTWDATTSNRRLQTLNNLNFSGQTTADYFMYESRRDYFSTSYGGQYRIAGGFALYEAGHTEGQSFSGPAFTAAYTISVTTANAYAAGPSALATSSLIGANLQSHTVSVSVAGTGSTVSYNQIAVNKLSYTSSVSSLGSSSTTFTFTPAPSAIDRNTVACISIVYPHTLNMGNVSSMQMGVLDGPSGGTAYLNLSNFNDLNQGVWVYDLTNNRRIVVGDNGSSHEVLIPNSGGEKECYIYSEGEITTIGTLTPAGPGVNGKFTNYSVLPHDSAYLIVYNEKLTNSVSGNNFIADYITYRSINPDGGNYDVIAADIEELYDQFAFGIRKSPMAIRGFAEMTLTWATKPSNLLLLGKSVAYTNSRSTTPNFNTVLVPTFGWPSSDIMLTSGLDNTLYQPAIPTGRVAATTGEELGDYLNKVKELDANQLEVQSQLDINQTLGQEEWKKQILHFAGGTGASNILFQGYLRTYESTIEDTLFGGKVHTFVKNSSDPIQITTSDSIEDLINNGVSILTFFGHASGSGFDQNIDNPDAYDNKDGRYPLLIANSCLVGDIHQPTSLSNSEDWVLHPKGTIGFLASVSFGEPVPLDKYSRDLYRNLGQKMYGQSLGEIITQTIINVQDPTGANSNNLKKTCLFMTLHGDPAVVLNARSKPDYAIRVQDVFTTPNIVSTEIDSFDLNIIVTNLGRAIKKEIGIEIKRFFPTEFNAGYDLTTITANNIFYKDTFTVKLPVDLINGVGLNNFGIKVDVMDVVEELTENNNEILYSLLIKSDNIIPIYPYNFAVVPDIMQTLKASTGNPFALDTSYIFQIDTSDAFAPPMAQYTTSQTGGVVEWAPTQGSYLAALFSNPAFSAPDDSTVFFWRVAKNTVNPTWRESSFQHIEGKSGWGQAHFHQFKNDDFNLITYNKPARTFDYLTTPKELWCQSVGAAGNTADWLATEYRINGGNMVASSCGVDQAVIVAVIDPSSLEPWISNPTQCGTKLVKAEIFRVQFSAERLALESYLSSIPTGHYALAYTFRSGLTSTWDSSLFSAFQSIGWTSITPAVGDRPFICFTKVGDPSSVKEVIGVANNSTIVLSADLTTNNDFGYITTKNIGPARGWNSLHWDMKTLDLSDSVKLQVSGIDAAGNTVIIPGLSSISPDSSDIFNLGALIDSSLYSKIQLRVHKGDSLKTAAQLRSWHVLLDDVPESALNPSIHLSFKSDTVDEGELVSFSTVVQNISEYDMDSLLISFWIVDRNRNIIPLPSIRYKPLLQSPDTILTGLTFATKGLPGNNSLWIEVNPFVNSKGGFDQLEKYHFNNIAEQPFYVKGDQQNPLVDVTFDGVHILDGDIVSAQPHIVVELKDENQYLALSDTALMRVYLTLQGQIEGDPIPYSGNTLRFIPASLPENRARVELDPNKLADGIYELRVQAQDVSKNESGDLDYLITFEVINKPTITAVMNWPNPFSTSTRFVFTLTGSEPPQDFRIRILTISGRVVREIFADELGPIHIGKNITEYAWDGKDEYGDQLANGVYLYKVNIQLNDDAMELRETNADQFFHKGYGKMYLLR